MQSRTGELRRESALGDVETLLPVLSEHCFTKCLGAVGVRALADESAPMRPGGTRWRCTASRPRVRGSPFARGHRHCRDCRDLATAAGRDVRVVQLQGALLRVRRHRAPATRRRTRIGVRRALGLGSARQGRCIQRPRLTWHRCWSSRSPSTMPSRRPVRTQPT
jgi:hypothetical protein